MRVGRGASGGAFVIEDVRYEKSGACSGACSGAWWRSALAQDINEYAVLFAAFEQSVAALFREHAEIAP